jgi:hypothetical protein
VSSAIKRVTTRRSVGALTQFSDQGAALKNKDLGELIGGNGRFVIITMRREKRDKGFQH